VTLKRKTPLRKRQGPAKPRGPRTTSPTKGKASKARSRARKAKRFERQFGPPGFAEFVRNLPCVSCGHTPCEVSHDPSRGAGGTWLDCHSLCRPCHRRLHQGHETFWAELGMTREQANARTQMAW
jgi:hypothetical protein